MASDMKPVVCILTAGRGTRVEPHSTYINKALLPIGRRAVISRIIEKFPDNAEFVVATGYLGEQVRNYLKIAHPSSNISFVAVDNYDGTGSGPGYSLACCRDLLQKPFYFVSCDTLWDNDIPLDGEKNWLGVARVPDEESARYCNVELGNGRIVKLRDKERVKGDSYRAFVGLCFIRDYETFWEGLGSGDLIAGERQISNGLSALVERAKVYPKEIDWSDMGSLEQYKEIVGRYEDYDFSKTNEFLYLLNGKVIKFFSDKSITEKRVAKSRINPQVFPKISDHINQFMSYSFVPGKTLYDHNNIAVFKKLLQWLDKNLWVEKKCDRSEMRNLCKKFYHDKTMERLEKYRQKYDAAEAESEINGVEVPPVSSLMEQVPWELLYDGAASFMHGDLQFDNIIRTDEGDFVLLDWRQDFGGHVELGDKYYDIAKLLGGINLNYDYIKQNLLYYSEEGQKIYFDFALRRSAALYQSLLNEYIMEKGYDAQKVRILVAIIYLNMSPLHNYPFDKMLHAMGRLALFQELKKAEGVCSV